MNHKPSVLFVCLGNICRSPMAEGAFREAARLAGLEIDTDSAGTGAWHAGKAPDKRAQEVARQDRVEINHFRARQICEADFDRFTHIYVMDHENLANVRRLAPPESCARISLLLDVVIGREGSAVADPYYGGMENFQATWADVQSAAEALARKFMA